VKILLTGGSSFTGFWFIKELARAGHEVTATFRKRPEEYADEARRTRVSLALKYCRGVFGCSFGDPAFLELARGERWDLLCHHAADGTNYKSPDFDAIAALRANTRSIGTLIDALQGKGREGARLLLTGSVFENDEGAGSQGLPAFSPYGLSKAFTYQTFRYHAARAGIPLGKFVIPNPFGPHEDPRFTAYLMKCWFAGETAAVQTPEYVRDNIHVSLLAKAYAGFAAEFADGAGMRKLNPSGYAESQGAFALRFAAEMKSRLGMPCKLDLKRQADFPEPRVRINTDPVDGPSLGWNEAQAWDEVADYYRQLQPGSRRT
jgi:nucleoside-diphosphate-sugar epimerase